MRPAQLLVGLGTSTVFAGLHSFLMQWAIGMAVRFAAEERGGDTKYAAFMAAVNFFLAMLFTCCLIYTVFEWLCTRFQTDETPRHTIVEYYQTVLGTKGIRAICVQVGHLLVNIALLVGVILGIARSSGWYRELSAQGETAAAAGCVVSLAVDTCQILGLLAHMVCATLCLVTSIRSTKSTDAETASQGH